MFSMSAHRAELLFCSLGSDRWCCLAAASERRRFWRCCTRWRRPAPHGLCYSCPDQRDKIGQDFDAAGHLSRSALDKIGLPREADVFICGPTRFMADMRAALAGFGLTPARIRTEVFSGGEP